MSKSVTQEPPMYNICNEATDALNEFINREYIYVYAPYDKTKLFTLEDKIDYLHNSTLSLDEYIKTHNLEYKWTRINIKDNFSYKQQKRFEKSGLSLDDYITKNNLYTSTISDSDVEDKIDEYLDDNRSINDDEQ